MKLSVLCYLPPPEVNGTVFHTEVFLRNLEQNPPAMPLMLYSDHPWQIPSSLKSDLLQLKMSPDKIIPKNHNFTLPNGTRNTFALNNLLFFTGLKLAKESGVNYMLYLEADCRVKGKGWDLKLWDEFFAHPVPAICGGTPVCYNPANSGPEGLARWLDFANKNTRRNFPGKTILPVPPGVYGFKGSSDDSGSCVFPNGAGGIYSIGWLSEIYHEAVAYPQVVAMSARPQTEVRSDWSSRLAAAAPPPAVAVAGSTYAWDFDCGMQIWQRFGVQSYDVIANLPSLYSSYGDVITTEAERLEMLRTGACTCVHQVKSSATV